MWLWQRAAAWLVGSRTSCLVCEAVNRFEDPVGLLEVGEMSGCRDWFESAVRERRGVSASVRLRRNLVAFAPDSEDRVGRSASRRRSFGSCM
jgi:hypothetical protein